MLRGIVRGARCGLRTLVRPILGARGVSALGLAPSPAPARIVRLMKHLSADASNSNVAAAGMLVKVHYTGCLEDGTVFDSSEGKEPLSFKVAAGQMVPGFDKAVEGMMVGETKDIVLTPADAYGERLEHAVVQVESSRLPAGTKVGEKLKNGDGGPVTVTDIDGDVATVDMNHHLAGKVLRFNINLVSCAPGPIVIREVLAKGDGATFPQPGDTLQMHYIGTLASDGQKFDSSVERGTPFEFRIGIGQVIEGWDEGVMKMSLGEKATLRIPAAMGYGEAGAGGVIPPNADLVFEVELLGINPPQQGHGHSHDGVSCDGNH